MVLKCFILLLKNLNPYGTGIRRMALIAPLASNNLDFFFFLDFVTELFTT